jgi:hypothetical protein
MAPEVPDVAAPVVIDRAPDTPAVPDAAVEIDT